MPRRVYQAQRQGNLLWVRAAVGVNGGEPITLRLLVDTGSSFTVLPTAVVEDLGCNLSQPNSGIAIFAASGRLMTPIVAVPWFNCLGKHVENFPVAAFNLPVRVLVDGLLGIDFLSRFGAVIDTGKSTVSLPNEVE